MKSWLHLKVNLLVRALQSTALQPRRTLAPVYPHSPWHPVEVRRCWLSAFRAPAHRPSAAAEVEALAEEPEDPEVAPVPPGDGVQAEHRLHSRPRESIYASALH
jgi:hypothetical protein